MKISSQRPY